MTGGILAGMRVVEGSAFVAAPLGGMTLAQLGADVIRFDQIGGGPDANRWPLDKNGNSLFWAGLNKGKRSIQIDLRAPAGQEIVTALFARYVEVLQEKSRDAVAEAAKGGAAIDTAMERTEALWREHGVLMRTAIGHS